MRPYQAQARHVEAALVCQRQAVRLEQLRVNVPREVAVVSQGALQRVQNSLRGAQERPPRPRSSMLNEQERAAGPQHAPDLAEGGTEVCN